MPPSLVHVDVAFRPELFPSRQADVCIVVDVLRATSTLITMFARGLEEALIAPSIEEARRVARERHGWLLCGEVGGLPPEGFDYGNSPSQFDGLSLRGRRAVLATTNGTKALTLAAGTRVVLVGALLNARAVAAEALHVAGTAGEILILCAGENGGAVNCVEDSFCAGKLVQEVVRHGQGRVRLRAGGKQAHWVGKGLSPLENLRSAEHGRALIALGFEPDVEFCARADRFTLVPRAERTSQGLVRVNAPYAATLVSRTHSAGRRPRP